MKRFNTVLLLLGLALLVFLLHKVGLKELWQQVRGLGWGVVPLILSEGVGNLFHTVGWRYVNNQRPRVPLGRLFRIAMAGYALNYLTPSASMGGEVSKATLLATNGTGSEAISSVLMDKLCMACAHLIVAILGAFFLLWQVQLPIQLWVGMAVGSGLLTCGMVTFFSMQKHGKMGVFFRWLVERNVGGITLQKAAQRISKVDEALKAFHRERRANLALSIGWHVLGHAVAFFQVWLFLQLLHQPAPLIPVLIAGFLGLWIDLLTFAIPLNLGALEGSRILALKTIGCEAAQGLAFGVAIRIAQLFWALFGLLAWVAFSVKERMPGVVAENTVTKN